jgi:ribosomal protein L16 Arg81 hydroxylase
LRTSGGLPEPGTPAFLKEVWRRQPAVYRGLLGPKVLSELQSFEFSSYCRKPATSRIFARGSGSRLIPDPAKAWAIFDQFRESAELTLLLNSVERVERRLVDLQTLFGIPFDWRRDDVVASISTPNSGIGYHAGREDGFVFQVMGSRRWRVWPEEVVEPSYKRFLLGDDATEPRGTTRPDAAPLLDCVLEPGDAMYTPTLFAHEGGTIEESVSISFAWGGVSAYHVLIAIDGRHPPAVDAHPELFRLIPDVLPDAEGISRVTDFLSEAYASLPSKPSEAELTDHVTRLLAR